MPKSALGNLHTITEWEKLMDLEIIDPDGFDRTDADLYKRLMDKETFLFGAMGSTVGAHNLLTMNGHLTKEFEDKYFTRT